MISALNFIVFIKVFCCLNYLNKGIAFLREAEKVLGLSSISLRRGSGKDSIFLMR